MKTVRMSLKQAGVAYLAMLIALAIIGAFGAGAVTVGASMQRRFAEDELLFIGGQFQSALQAYYETTPRGGYPYPNALADLLRDPRYPSPRRYLRQIYADPLTGLQEWGLIVAPGGGVMGVHSLSREYSIRQTGFPSEFVALEGRAKYNEWVFFYSPGQPSPP